MQTLESQSEYEKNTHTHTTHQSTQRAHRAPIVNSFKRAKHTQKHIICQLEHIKGEQCLLKRRLKNDRFYHFLTGLSHLWR